VRSFALLLCTCLLAVPARAQIEEPVETPIVVPSPVPVGFLLAWKPMLLSVRVDSGVGSEFGSDKLKLLRGLFRWTTTLFGERLFARAEIEGGEFQSDTQGSQLGTDGVDLTFRALFGTATRISPGFTITASAGPITRYQWGIAEAGAPRIGIFGITTNLEAEYRVAPLITLGGYVELALTPIPYAAQKNLGNLSDANEFRLRLQVSLDVSPGVAVDLGYDFTRWHSSFSQSSVNSPTGGGDQALLLEAREHAIAFGIRWKP
jgi:hypothetical protein